MHCTVARGTGGGEAGCSGTQAADERGGTAAGAGGGADAARQLVAENTTGYFGVYRRSGRHKPYDAQVRRGGTTVHLGNFATAEEAALCITQSPERRAAAAEWAAPQLSEEEGKCTVPLMPPGAFVKEEDVPAAAFVKEEGAVPPIPPDAFVVKTEAIVKEEGSSCSRPKRQRRK